MLPLRWALVDGVSATERTEISEREATEESSAARLSKCDPSSPRRRTIGVEVVSNRRSVAALVQSESPWEAKTSGFLASFLGCRWKRVLAVWDEERGKSNAGENILRRCDLYAIEWRFSLLGGIEMSRTVDYQAVVEAQAVIHRYVRSIDATDAQAVAAHFAEDGVCTGGFGAVSGRQSLVSFYEAAWAEGDARRTHFVTNVIVERSDEGRIEASALFLMTTRTDEHVDLGWGTYRYSFGRADALLHELSIAVDDSVPLTKS